MMNWKLLFVLFLGCLTSNAQEKELSYFTAKAAQNSPLLKDYSNQIQSTTLDSLLNKAQYKPQVNGILNANYAPVINKIGYDTAITNGQNVTGLVGINQRLLSKNQLNTQAETFQIIKQSLTLNKKIAVKDLNKAITAQYITATATQEQMNYNQKINDVLHEEAIVLKKLTQHSVYKQTDYLIFNATLQQQELLVLQLKQQYQNDLGLLNYLSGETDTTFVFLKKPEIALTTIGTSPKNIFLKQFENDSLAIRNQKQLLSNAYKPTISLLGDAGYISSFAYQPYKNFGFSVGLGMSIPIYNGHQRQLQYQKSDAALATNLAYKVNFHKQYQQKILLLQQKLKQTTAVQHQLQSQLQIAETLIEAHRKLLLTGDAQITEFVLAIGNLIGIQNAIAQNNSDKLQVINEINYWSSND